MPNNQCLIPPLSPPSLRHTTIMSNLTRARRITWFMCSWRRRSSDMDDGDGVSLYYIPFSIHFFFSFRWFPMPVPFFLLFLLSRKFSVDVPPWPGFKKRPLLASLGLIIVQVPASGSTLFPYLFLSIASWNCGFTVPAFGTSGLLCPPYGGH